MPAIRKTHIQKSQVDMEQHITKAIQVIKVYHCKDASIKFYNENKQLYLETEVSGVRSGAGLLHVRDGM